jgi:hypothetical protein
MSLPFAVNGVIVKVSPTSASVPLNKTQQFTATVSGTDNSAVVWAVNDILGGNSSIGTIDGNGFYTSPATLPSPPSVIVTATSSVQPTAKGLSYVHLCTPIDSNTGCGLLYGLGGNGNVFSMDPGSGVANQIYSFPPNLGAYQWETALDRVGLRYFAIGGGSDPNSNSSTLYTIDLTKTNTATVQTVPNLDNLTFDPSTGLLYGIDQDSGAILVSLDPSTGTVTPIYTFPSGFVPLYGFTLDPNGRRFFTTGSSPNGNSTQLFEIDLTKTNTATVLEIPNIPNIRFDVPSGLLYGTETSSSVANVVSLDPSSGAVTPIYTFPSGVGPYLWQEALDSTDRLYFVFANSSLYEIDLTQKNPPVVMQNVPTLSGFQY